MYRPSLHKDGVAQAHSLLSCSLHTPTQSSEAPTLMTAPRASHHGLDQGLKQHHDVLLPPLSVTPPSQTPSSSYSVRLPDPRLLVSHQMVAQRAVQRPRPKIGPPKEILGVGSQRYLLPYVTRIIWMEVSYRAFECYPTLHPSCLLLGCLLSASRFFHGVV